MLKIMFWKNKQSGNLLSHHNGLTQDLVDQLKEVKEGDRLILWVNKSDKENYPEMTLKIFKRSEEK